MSRKVRRYLVTAMFDIEALNMAQAKDIADSLLKLSIDPYVRVKDKETSISYEHLADGKWRKTCR